MDRNLVGRRWFRNRKKGMPVRNDQRQPKTPASCPICHMHDAFVNTRVRIADALIYKCKECSGYFLFPPKIVEYTDSGWTSRREADWQQDVQIAKDLAPRIIECTSAHLGRPVQKIIEIGCGSAFMGMGFTSLACRYTGIDVDAKSVEFAKSQGIDAHCIALEDIGASTSPIVGKYDLVLSSNVFEHLDDPSRAFANLRLICNGIVVIVVPNARGLYGILRSHKICSKAIQWVLGTKREIAYSIDGYWHNIAYTSQTLEYLCAKAGIEVTEIKPMSINDPVFGFVQPNRTLSYRLASAVAALLKMDSEIVLIGKLNS